jgi:hypothetical protein
VFSSPLISPTWAKLIAIMAVAPTTEPELRSMPPVMITWVTPRAMMPMIETWRMMISSRCWLKIVSTFSRVLKRKLSCMTRRPSTSKTTTIRTSARKTPASGGKLRLEVSKVRPPTPCDVSAMDVSPKVRGCRRASILSGAARGAAPGVCPKASPAQLVSVNAAMFSGVTSWYGT